MIFRIIQSLKWPLHAHPWNNSPFLVYQYKTIFSLSLDANLKIGDDVSTVILNCPSSLMSFFRTVPPNSLLSIFCLKQDKWMDEWVNRNNFTLSKKLLETLLKLQLLWIWHFHGNTMGSRPSPLKNLQEVLFACVVHSVGVSKYGHHRAQGKEVP